MTVSSLCVGVVGIRVYVAVCASAHILEMPHPRVSACV